jgi:nucleoside-diphosphate-sugar epimerase
VSAVDNGFMAKVFRRYEPDQLLLLPPSLSEWVPEGHLARFVGDLVDVLDLSAIEESYGEERGLEQCLGRTAVKKLLPMQPGDVEATAADVSDLEALVGAHPATPLEEGIRRFVAWYQSYYAV